MTEFKYGDNKYRATILRWVDGDTVHLRVDLGQQICVENHYRLARVDAPETTLRAGVTAEEKRAGLELKARLTQEHAPGSVAWISTEKAGKFGRYLVEMWVWREGELINMNDWLLGEGLVQLY
jgi:micrococcal nuclease